MSTLLFLLLLIAFFVAFGRSATPPVRRIPIMALTLRDVVNAAARGVAELNRLHRRRWPNPWDSTDDH